MTVSRMVVAAFVQITVGIFCVQYTSQPGPSSVLTMYNNIPITKCFNDLHHLLSVLFLSPPPPPGKLYLSLAYQFRWGCYRGGNLENALEPCSGLSNRPQWLPMSTGEIQAAWGPCLRQLLLCSHCAPISSQLYGVLACPWKHDYLFLLWSFLHSSESLGFIGILKCLYITILTSGMLLST